MSAHDRPESSRALCSAATWPLREGLAMLLASHAIPYPDISAWIRRPRTAACSSLSTTITPAPSPRTKPDRSLENGLHDASGCAGSHCASTFIALHAAILPALSSDSLPPAMAMSKYPSRTDRNASPIAIADDAHATE